jgi:hypothetical protein
MDWGFVLRAIAAVATPLAKDKLQRNEIVKVWFPICFNPALYSDQLRMRY